MGFSVADAAAAQDEALVVDGTGTGGGADGGNLW